MKRLVCHSLFGLTRGTAVDAKGGKEGPYAVQSAVRMAMEMGATIIKANLPEPMKQEDFDNKEIPDFFKKQEKEIQAMSDPFEQKESASDFGG